MIGVAAGEQALGRAVVGEHEQVRAPVEAGQMPLDLVGQGCDVARMVMVGRQRAHRRLPTHLLQRVERLVVGGGGGGRRILRIERHQQHPAAALRHQPVEHALHARIAVAHRPVDHQPWRALLQPCRQLLRLAAGDRLERALVALLVPDRVVVVALARGTLAQDHELQQRLPEPGRIVDHPLVGEELGEIAPHRPVVGGVRRAEIHQHDADAVRARRPGARQEGLRLPGRSAFPHQGHLSPGPCGYSRPHVEAKQIGIGREGRTRGRGRGGKGRRTTSGLSPGRNQSVSRAHMLAVGSASTNW